MASLFLPGLVGALAPLSSIDNDSSVHAHVAARAAIRIWAFDSDPVAAMACC